MEKTFPLLRKSCIRYEHLIVWLLFVLAVFLRWLNLNPLMPFTFDQGRDLLALQEMASGDVRLIGPTTGIAGFFLGPFYYYFLLPGFFLGQGDPYVVAYWNAIWITLGLALTYYILKPVVGRNLAFVGYLWLLVTPGSLENGRIIWNPSLTAMTLAGMLFGLFASTHSKKSQRYLWLSLALFSFGLSLQTELAYAIFLAPLLLWWLWKHWDGSLPFKKQLKKEGTYSWQTIVIGSLAGLSTFAPQLVFEIKNNFLMTQSLVRELQDTSKQVPYLQVWTTRPGQMLSEISRQLTAHGPLRALGSVVFVTGLLGVFFKKDSRVTFLIWMSIAPLLGLLLFRGNSGAFFPYYLSPHYYAVILSVVATLSLLLKRANKATMVSFRAGTLVVSLVVSSGLMKYWPIMSDTSILAYTAGLQVDALKSARVHGQSTEHRPLGADVFVPNLLPTQYRYLNGWINETETELPEIEFNVSSDHTQYYLIWEPAYDDGSLVAYDDWRKRMTMNATCEVIDQPGIITVEVCRRAN